jgi:hypothetical protein
MQNVYYKGVAAARMEENGKQLYNSNIESEYTGKEGHIVADINGKHFEKKFKDGLFPLPINISPYSSIEMLKEKYGLLGKKSLKNKSLKNKSLKQKQTMKKGLKKYMKRGKRQTYRH